MTESGIFCGEISQKADNPNFVSSKKTLEFPEQQSDFQQSSYRSKSSNQTPNSFILTDFHLLLQYSDRIIGISLINHQIVYEEYFSDQNGKLISIVKDAKSGNVFTFDSKSIYRYRINNEQRNVWKMYLQKGEFELAKKYSRDNPANYDMVLSKIGDDLFERKQFLESAQIYAQTKKTFEEVTLKFMQSNQNLALIHYLKSRLFDLDPSTGKNPNDNVDCVVSRTFYDRTESIFDHFSRSTEGI